MHSPQFMHRHKPGRDVSRAVLSAPPFTQVPGPKQAKPRGSPGLLRCSKELPELLASTGFFASEDIGTHMLSSWGSLFC